MTRTECLLAAFIALCVFGCLALGAHSCATYHDTRLKKMGECIEKTQKPLECRESFL